MKKPICLVVVKNQVVIRLVIIIGEVGGNTGNSNTAIGSGNANYYDYSNKPKKHH